MNPALARQRLLGRVFAVGLLALMVLPASGCRPEAGKSVAEPPNIVLIIGDDHGYMDFGFMGSPVVQTPNLDRLAAEGIVFRSGYSTASVCRPALQSLLTGLHPVQWNYRVARLRERGIRRGFLREIEDFETLPRILARHGYSSFQAGKYWESEVELAGFTDGMANAEADWSPASGSSGESARTFVRETMDPLFDFLEANGDGPFFVWFAPMLPHTPLDPPERLLALYDRVELPDQTRRYYANISRFDEGVGRLLDFLDARALTERTLVVYVVDNGWFPGNALGPNKLSLYELGFRTPIIFSWPGRLASGRTSDALVSTVDLFPTLLSYAGIPASHGYPGRDLSPLIDGSVSQVRDFIAGTAEMVRWGVPRSLRDQAPVRGRFIRTAKWHYMQYGTRVDQLYDVDQDPRARLDLASQHPELLEIFHGRLDEWETEMIRDWTFWGPQEPTP